MGASCSTASKLERRLESDGRSRERGVRIFDGREKTIRNYTSNIYRKLHIFDRTQAVIYAVREGVIDVEELEYRPPREP